MRNLFVPAPVSYDIRNFRCTEPFMSKETFYRHYFDVYLPMYKRLNQMIEGSCANGDGFMPGD